MAAMDVVGYETARTLFELLVCVAWADGVVQPEEAEATRAAAVSLGLQDAPDRAFHDLSEGPVPVEKLPLASLSGRDAQIAYVCAAWMVLADDVEAPEEQALLPRVQDALRIDDATRDKLTELARTLREKEPPTESWWRRFDRLVVGAAKEIAKGA